VASSWFLFTQLSGKYFHKKKTLKMQVRVVQKRQHYGIPFTVTVSLYNYYQSLVVFTAL